MDDEFDVLIALPAEIAAAEEAGPDGRSDPDLAPLLLALKDARMEAREAERHATSDQSVPLLLSGQAHWAQIVRDAPDYLRRSKDIDVATWLVEAAVRLYGFAGLAASMETLAALVTRFWDMGAHPQLSDTTEPEDRTAPLTALNGAERPGTLIQPVRLLAFTRGGGETYAYWQFEAALALQRLADREARERRIEQGAISLDMFVQSLLGTPAENLRALYGHVQAAFAAHQRIQAHLRAALGDGAPPGSFITGLLEGLIGCLTGHASHVDFTAGPAVAAEAAAGATAGGAGGEGSGPLVTGGISSRAAALDQVLQIADYFERQEPNGLVALSLREVVRRARLPLLELLDELIPGADPRREFLMRAGVRVVEPSRDDDRY